MVRLFKDIERLIGYGIIIMYTVIGIFLYIGVTGSP